MDKILYPLRPYHERYREYVEARNRIFSVDSIAQNVNKRPKRSTLRLRNYFKLRKRAAKYVISGIVNCPHDKRYYAKVKFLEFSELGLLDTGANVSCIGSTLADHEFAKYSQFVPSKTCVRTADGRI